MRKAILIVGLPGSGKTEFGSTLFDQAGLDCLESAMWIDDPYPNDQDTLDWALKSSIDNILITDPTACGATWASLANKFDRYQRTYTIACYDNDPEACWANLQRRGDNKISRGALWQMSDQYYPESLHPDFQLGVWRPNKR